MADIAAALAGDAAAWQRLYRETSAKVRRLLAAAFPWGNSADRDDAVAEAWSQVWRNGAAALKRFDGTRCCFSTYFFAIARRCYLQNRRRESRLKTREKIVSRREGMAGDLPSEEDLFVGRLTHAERRFYRRVLLGDGQEESNANRWQLSHRVREKLLLHLGMTR